MITIQIQEAEAFDRLSILEIKKNNAPNAEIKIKLQNQILELEAQINNEIGYNKAREVYESLFYNNLFNVNATLFDLFDKCKAGGMDALEPDKWNISRHRAKNDLQEKFFGSKTEEVKLGYKDE